MKILAVEFSSAQRSVAILGREKEVEVVATGAAAAGALGMIDEALRKANLEREQIDCLVVGLGPGSYNGIRAAIALAQGWQLALGVNLLGISSAECLAAQAQAEGLRGKVDVVIDAQRGELYLASYEIPAAGRAEIEPLRIVTLAEMKQRAEAGGMILGPEVTRWFPAGRILFPRAAALGKLARSRNDFVAGEKLEPIYLRETTFVKAPPPRRFQTPE
jgi:tRNA threonylcarbamoyladenosine biosynthesis protein TsaB